MRPFASTLPLWRREHALRLGEAVDWRAFLGLVALVLYLVREAVFFGRVFFERDVFAQWYPQVQSFVRAVASGSWPTWDPYLSFGQPLLADPSAEVLYPFTWLNLLVLPGTYYTVFVAAHLLFSGLGSYALSRRLGVGPGGAFVSGALWIASGPHLSLVNLYHHFAGATWIPWVVLAAERALSSGRPRASLVLGAAMAMQVLAGSAEMCAMSALIVCAQALRRAEWRRFWGQANRRLLASLLLAVTFASALSACQWLPTLDLVQRSARRELPEALRTGWSVHPLAMLQVILPLAWETLPLRPDLHAELFHSREPFLASLYLGMASFALLTVAFTTRRAYRNMLAVIGALALLMALGRHLFVYPLAVRLLPPLGIFRYPAKAMILVAFAWALLGGMGFDAWREGIGEGRWRRAVVATLAALALLGTAGSILGSPGAAHSWGAHVLARDTGFSDAELLRFTAIQLAVATALTLTALLLVFRRLPGRVLAAGLGVVAILDLLHGNRNLNRTAPRELLYYRSSLLDHIPRGYQRLYVYEYYFVGRKSRQYLKRDMPYIPINAPPELDFPVAQAAAMKQYLFPPLAGAWGAYGSYEVDVRGLYPPYLTRLTLFLRSAEGTPLHLRLLRMGAVGHVVALHTEGLEELKLLGRYPSLFKEPIHVFQVPSPLARTYVVGRGRLADGERAFEILAGSEFDPETEVLIPEGPVLQGAPGFRGHSRIIEAKPDRVVLEAESSGPGYVVLVDTYDPGWTAMVDGRPSHILRANIAFRAVPVQAGRHVIEYRYRPRPLLLGLAVSVAAAVAALGWTLSGRRSPPTAGEGAGGSRVVAMM